MCIKSDQSYYEYGMKLLEQAHTLTRALVIMAEPITNEPTEDSCFVMRELLKLAHQHQSAALTLLRQVN